RQEEQRCHARTGTVTARQGGEFGERPGLNECRLSAGDSQTGPTRGARPPAVVSSARVARRIPACLGELPCPPAGARALGKEGRIIVDSAERRGTILLAPVV